MSNVLTAHQVGYMPWLGFFSKLASADLFCSFDAVQYERKGWINRNQIKTANGPLMLTVPVYSKEHFGTNVCEVEIVGGMNWVHKHTRSIELAYRKAPYFEQHYAGVGAILDLYAEGGLLNDLNLDLLRYFLRALGLQVPIVNASDYQFKGSKSLLVLDMCIQLRATAYIFGGEGEAYADKQAFHEAGIQPWFQKYQHPVYPQLHGEFVPNMSVVDLLMNCGPESLDILKTGWQLEASVL
jgi:hypothetical protein